MLSFGVAPHISGEQKAIESVHTAQLPSFGSVGISSTEPSSLTSDQNTFSSTAEVGTNTDSSDCKKTKVVPKHLHSKETVVDVPPESPSSGAGGNESSAPVIRSQLMNSYRVSASSPPQGVNVNSLDETNATALLAGSPL